MDAALDLEASRPPDPIITVTTTKRRYGPALPPFAVRLAVDNAAGTARLLFEGETTHDRLATANDVVRAVHELRELKGPDGADVKALAALLGLSERCPHPRRPAAQSRHPGEAGGGDWGRPKTVYDVEGGRD